MTLPNPPLGFPLTEGQPGRIYPSEIKRRKEEKPMRASWGKIAYPGVIPRTGAQVNRLPALTATIHAHQHHRQISYTLFFSSSYNYQNTTGKKENLHIIYIFQLFLHPVLLSFCHMHANTHTHTHTHSHSQTCTRIAPTPICMTLVSGEFQWGVKSVMGS